MAEIYFEQWYNYSYEISSHVHVLGASFKVFEKWKNFSLLDPFQNIEMHGNSYFHFHNLLQSELSYDDFRAGIIIYGTRPSNNKHTTS